MEGRGVGTVGLCKTWAEVGGGGGAIKNGGREKVVMNYGFPL